MHSQFPPYFYLLLEFVMSHAIDDPSDSGTRVLECEVEGGGSRTLPRSPDFLPGQLCSHNTAAVLRSALTHWGWGHHWGYLLDVARLGFFIEEKILYSFTVRVTRMENITSSIYDVISKGKVASAFFLL